ncbi:hypothetical protein RMCBS344292_14950 [Rhizopus microsporus]|nr:hypothetical protein RMCBS344292_14950 [Rhizopus microsporus]
MNNDLTTSAHQSINNSLTGSHNQPDHINNNNNNNVLSVRHIETVYQDRNTIRLAQIEQELRKISSYGSACDELLVWINDNRAYNSHYEAALLKCFRAIYETAESFGAWSGLQILKKASENRANLSLVSQKLIEELYEELKVKVLNKKKESASMVNPTTSTANSPTAVPLNSTSSGPSTPTTPALTQPQQLELSTSKNYDDLVREILASVCEPATGTAQKDACVNQPNQNTSIQNAPSPTATTVATTARSQQRVLSQSPVQASFATRSHPAIFINQGQPMVAPLTSHYSTLSAPILQQQQMAWLQYQQVLLQQQAQQQAQQQVQQLTLQQFQQRLQQKAQQLQQQAPRLNKIKSIKQYMVPASPTKQGSPQLQRTNEYGQTVQSPTNQSGASFSGHPQSISSPTIVQQQAAAQNAQATQYAYNSNQIAAWQQLMQQQNQKQQQLLQQQQEQEQRLRKYYNQQLLAAAVQMPQRGMQQRVQNAFIPQQMSPGYQSPQQQQFNNNNNISNQQQQPSAPVYIQPTQAQSQLSNTVGNSNTLQKQAQQSQQQSSSVSLAEIQAVSTAAMLPTTADLSIPARLTNGSNSSTSPTQPRPAQASTSNFGQQNAVYLPNITQPSFDQLVLPNKTTGLIPALANDSDPKDLADFLRPSSAILGPFRLVHSQRVTEKQFFIGKNYFTSLFNETNNRVKSPEKLPLTFLFTAWHVKSQERKVEWPEHMRAEVNGKQIYLERKMRVDGRIPIQTGKDKAYDLNNVLQEGTNVLRIYQDDCACSFNFCIRLYVRESENYIVEKVRKTPLSVQRGKEAIDKLLRKKDGSDDDEIAIEQKTLRVSLKCPITLTRIKIPAKGIKCKHVDCFDLHDYLLLNKMERPMWTCPHCNDVVTSEQLGYDLFFEGLLKTLPKNVSEIEFKDNHSTITVTKEDDLDDDNSNSNSEDEDGSMDNKAIIQKDTNTHKRLRLV